MPKVVMPKVEDIGGPQGREKMDVDCCGDRFQCDTTLRCKCGCGRCYCRSCFERHCVTVVESQYGKAELR